MQTLTEALALKAVLPETGHRYIYDDKIRSFALRLSAAGLRTWIVDVHQDRRSRRVTIGRVGEMPLAEARKLALKHKVEGKGRGGADRPKAVSDLWSRLHAEDAQRLRPGTLKLYKGYWTTHIGPAIGTRSLKAVTPGDVSKILAGIPGAATANRVHEILRRLFAFALRHDWLEANPAAHWPRRHESARESYLSPSELGRLFTALPVNEVGDALRFAALTGARIGEVLGMKRGDLKDAGTSWLKPATTTRQKRAHRVPLSAPAQALVQRQRDHHAPAGSKGITVLAGPEDYIFARADGRPIWRVNKTWIWALKRAHLPATTRVHDLRHSFASLLVSDGVSLPIIGAALGHSTPATTARYAHLADGTLRAAVNRLGTNVGANVVVLPTGPAQK